jgi:Ca-activated chloride channel family protein
MRRTFPLLLAVVLSLSIAAPALADGMLLPLPEALSPDYLAVRYHHVTVRIEDGHAVTRVEQEFYNPHGVPVNGRYLFPVPPEAILSDFQATVDGIRQTVTRQDAAATNADLYAILSDQHDPSLLQYADWESLAFDIGLPPGGSKQMSLEYEEVLAPSGGLYRYRYVLSTERYSSLPLDEASVTVDLITSSGLASLYSPSHTVHTEHLGGGRVRLTWEEQYTNPSQDFELFFAPTEGAFGGGLLTGSREGGGSDHFLFLFSPETETRHTDSLPKDIVFVIDRSGSMEGEKIEQAQDALGSILGQLGEEDRFSIVSFDDRISVLEYELQPVNWRTLDAARRYVYQLSADGSTDLESALQTGLEILERSENRGAPRMVIFLTDGLPTAGVTEEARIAHLVSKTNRRLEARLHVFGVGYDVNTHLLDRLSADNGGSVTYVQPGENLEVALTEFYGKIAHPLLTDLEIEFEGLEATDLYPEALPNLFQGSSLLLTGRYEATGRPVTVRVRGSASGETREYVYRFDLEETRGLDFVPRLWATRRVGALLDRVRVEGESQALVDEIRELGLAYGIVTPYTTFVIAGQAEGAASMDNMALYDSAEVNEASGRVTIMARVQNQAYQQTAQAGLAVGANVQNYGEQSLAQVGRQQVDLSLLQGQKDLGGPIDDLWIERNVKVDRTIEFGSDEYFALASDPEARAYLQSGANVLFEFQGEILSVEDPDYQAPEPAQQELKIPLQTSPRISPADGQGSRSTGLALLAARGLLSLLLPLAALVVVAMVLGFLIPVALVLRYAVRTRPR